METEKSIFIPAAVIVAVSDTEVTVNCPYCQGQHQHPLRNLTHYDTKCENKSTIKNTGYITDDQHNLLS